MRSLGGALATVSGRPLREIDALLGTRRRRAAGLAWRGASRSGGHATLASSRCRSDGLDAARERAVEVAAAIPGLLVEDKGGAIALHYRAAPDAETRRAPRRDRMLDARRRRLRALHGKCVIELKPATPTRAPRSPR